MKPRVVRLSGGRFRVLHSNVCCDPIVLPPPIGLTKEDLWNVRVEMFAEAYAEAASKECPLGARLIPLADPRRMLYAIVDESDFERCKGIRWRA